MSLQLKMWKRLIINQFPLSCHCPSIAISLLPSVPFYAKSDIKFANFSNQRATPSKSPPVRGVITDFLTTKCGLTDQDIAKGFRHCNGLLRLKSTQHMEEVLELLEGCGLTTSQVRTVVLCNPLLLFNRTVRNVKSKLIFLRTVIKEEDISKLVINDANIFDAGEDKLKSAISLFLRLGYKGNALSHLVASQPRLLKISEEKVLELFKQIENLGFRKGSKSFAAAVTFFLAIGKETLERKLQYLRSLGLSEKQISELCRRETRFLALSEDKLGRNVDFMVNFVGLQLADLVKFPHLFEHSLEKRIIPRYRVMEALKSMQAQELERELSLPQIFYLTEGRFLKIYVNNNPESSKLLDIYHGGKAAKVILNKKTRSECVSV